MSDRNKFAIHTHASQKQNKQVDDAGSTHQMHGKKQHGDGEEYFAKTSGSMSQATFSGSTGLGSGYVTTGNKSVKDADGGFRHLKTTSDADNQMGQQAKAPADQIQGMVDGWTSKVNR